METLNNLSDLKNIREFTPDNITHLAKNEIFVYGCNSEGVHGKGAALIAKQNFGAKQGKIGFSNQSYGIITKKNWRIKKSSSLSEIQNEIKLFLKFAQSKKNLKFYVTLIGTKNAGYEEYEIKQLFVNLKEYISNNVILPKQFEFRS